MDNVALQFGRHVRNFWPCYSSAVFLESCIEFFNSSISSLVDKVYDISEAISGIGLATAKHLYSLGAQVSITDVRNEVLETALKTITASTFQPDSNRIFLAVTDVQSSAQVDTWINDTVSHFGRLDGAANLAGVMGKHIGIYNIMPLSNEEWNFVNDVNLTGVFNALRAQLQAMENLGNGGSIVNDASTAGIEGNAKNANYSAANHGVVGLSRSAAKEVGMSGIRVNAIAP